MLENFDVCIWKKNKFLKIIFFRQSNIVFPLYIHVNFVLFFLFFLFVDGWRFTQIVDLWNLHGRKVLHIRWICSSQLWIQIRIDLFVVINYVLVVKCHSRECLIHGTYLSIGPCLYKARRSLTVYTPSRSLDRFFPRLSWSLLHEGRLAKKY